MKTQYLVVDTAALVKHVPLWEYAETLFSVPEIITEIRDKEARRRLETLPFPITMRQPQPSSIKFVNEFSKKTGDYASLSLADIKVLALTYELEVEVEGSAAHLNSEPRRIVTEGPTKKNTHKKQQQQLEEEDTEAARTEEAEPKQNTLSKQHILALNSHLLHHSYISGHTPSHSDIEIHKAISEQYKIKESNDKDTTTITNTTSPTTIPSTLPHAYPHLSRWLKHMSSFTEEDQQEFGSLCNEKCLRDILQSLVRQLKEEQEEEEVVKERLDSLVIEDDDDDDTQTDTTPTQTHNTEREEREAREGDCENESKEGREERESDPENESGEEEGSNDDDDDDDGGGWITCENIKKHRGKRNVFGDVKEEEEEEEKDVKVACITADFAIQNVLKHIGLSVMGVDGKIIKHLKTYILRCHACFKTTSVMDKIFCPHCGNKTLKKVSVTLDPDGTQRIWINTKRPISKRGTKFSLPTPKGGKHGRNPILVADQREAKKFSSKMSRKKINPLHEDYNPDQMPFAVRDVYSRAAQLGYIGGKNHNHFYWEKRNPNEPQRRTGKK